MDPNELISMLMQLIQPQEAEAAQSRTASKVVPPGSDLFDPAIQQYVAKLKAAQQVKAAAPAGPDLATLLSQISPAAQAPGLPGDILRGGPDAPITFGINPRTGTPTFNNLGWVNAPPEGYARSDRAAIPSQYYGPEAQASVEAARTKAAQPDTGKEYWTKVVEAFHKAKIPIPTAVSQALGNALTGGAPIKPELLGGYFKFDPKTAELTPYQGDPETPAAQILREGYRRYDKTQLDKFYAADVLDKPLAEFKATVERAAKYGPFALKLDQILSAHGAGALSPLTEDPGLGVEFAKSAFNVTQLYDQLVAGARGAASPQLAKLRQAALPALLEDPQLRAKLLTSFEDLVSSLKQISKAKAIGIVPDAKALSDLDKQAEAITQAVTSRQKLTAGGMQKGQQPAASSGDRVPMINPQGKPVTVPANQAAAALQQGYKPYQQ